MVHPKAHGFSPKSKLVWRRKLGEVISRALAIGHSSRRKNDPAPPSVPGTARPQSQRLVRGSGQLVFASFYFSLSFALSFNVQSQVYTGTYGSVFLKKMWDVTESRTWAETGVSGCAAVWWIKCPAAGRRVCCFVCKKCGAFGDSSGTMDALWGGRV